ncbi:YihY/virulence factor BrkB family protein [Polyangium jinanense]|uniref:YihY/virulence factor BrkB family protein n=1 Tax=Polyangium jinanense TaxID=2829994 RepID=A0A9X3X8D5_9BACT|nr:YihY/virulence factor BrkB family protein [Polyangium jinanense]MDC3954280.1 YihY/virulence factor BrkB family protein [Polyangium jinanense]MDC3984268.1 YihY/virulence factor BrkB family protein [Polyangium jinanense]
MWDRRHLSGLASSAFRALGRLVHYLDLHEAPRAASAMAFDAFLSIIPLLAVAGWALHRLRDAAAELLGSLLSAAPPSVSAALGEDFFRISDAKALVLAPLGLLAFLWVSSAGAATAIGVFETMFVCTPRPWWKRRLVGLGLVLGAIPAVGIATFVGIVFTRVTGSLGDALVAALGPGVILIALVAGFFRFTITRPPTVRRRVWPGAIVTVSLWAIVSTLFSVYVRSLARYATLYGTLANVAVLLFWLWLLSISLLVGGEVNAQLEGVRDPHDDAPERWLSPKAEGPRSIQPPPPPASVLRPKRTASSE